MKQKVFIQLLTRIFFIVFIVTLLTGVLSFFLTSRRMSEENYRHTTEVLDQTRNLVDTILEQIELTAYTIAINSDVLKCLSREWRIEEEYQTLVRVNDLFIDKIHSSSFLHSISLYSELNDKVICDSGIIELDLHRDRELLDRYITNRSPSVWLNTRKNPGDIEDTNVISLLLNVPLNSQNVRGTLIINVVEDFLNNAIVDLKSTDLGEIYIVDEQGTVLSNIHKERIYTQLEYFPLDTLRGHGYHVRKGRDGNEFVSYTTSNYSDWIYIAVTPYAAVMRSSRLMLIISLIVSGCSLAIGLVLSFYVSKVYYRPIKNILNILSDYDDTVADTADHNLTDEMTYIDDSLHKLLNQNREFEQRFGENRNMLREHFLFNLLIGRETDAKLIKKQCGYYGITLQYGYFAVLMISLKDPSNTVDSEIQNRSRVTYALSLNAQQIVKKKCNGFVLSRAWNELVVLLNMSGLRAVEDAVTISRQIAEEIRSSLSERIAESIHIGVGNPYEDLTEIRYSYSEALDALNYQGIAARGNTIHISDLIHGERGSSKSVLTFEAGKELIISALKAGNVEAAETEISRTLSVVFNDYAMSILQRKAFLIDLANSIISVVVTRVGAIDGIFSGAPLYELDKMRSREEIEGWFISLIHTSLNAMGEPPRSHSRDIVKSIQAYMTAHFAEEIDLDRISELTTLSARYFCRIYKEETGMTYFEYLTHLRLNAACELLTATDKPIHDIAKETGFINKRNIARAFKKYKSVTPTEYRTRAVVNMLSSVTTLPVETES